MPNTAVDRAALEGVVDEVRELIEEVRRVSNNLAPSMLEDFGLCAALRGLCSDFRSESCSVIPVCDTCVDESKIPDIIRFTVYRVAQEAMNNIGKHSMATMASVDLRGENGGLRLLIEDNGAGFDINHVAASETNLNRGAGLRNMRDRVQVTGGEFSIRSEPGQGVAIESSWSADNLALLLGDETVLYGIDGNG
jgi:two-component system NarL family sensor kinase